MEELNSISYKIIGSAYEVHRQLGPGLLESTYQVCLASELNDANLKVEIQKPLPVIYKNIKLDAGYRIDLLVEDKIIIELKAVDEIAPIHEAQLLTYLKLSDKKLGLLINFNVKDLKKGIKRMVL
jgi:GxxExxY protein